MFSCLRGPLCGTVQITDHPHTICRGNLPQCWLQFQPPICHRCSEVSPYCTGAPHGSLLRIRSLVPRRWRRPGTPPDRIRSRCTWSCRCRSGSSCGAPSARSSASMVMAWAGQTASQSLHAMQRSSPEAYLLVAGSLNMAPSVTPMPVKTSVSMVVLAKFSLTSDQLGLLWLSGRGFTSTHSPPDACLVWTWWIAGLEAATLVTWDLADGKQPPLDLARLQIFARIAMF